MKIGKTVESRVRHVLADAKLYEQCFHHELHSRMSKEVHKLIDVSIWDSLIESVTVIAKCDELERWNYEAMKEWNYENR